MPKKDNIKIFIDKIYSSPPKKNYETNKLVYIHIGEIWSFGLADFSDFETSNNKSFRYFFVLIDKFSKFLWCVPLKNSISQTITADYSNILTKSKRSPLKLESDRGSEWYNLIFQSFSKGKSIQHYSRFTGKELSIAERGIRTT